jgi:acyl-CoA reductase-like NAD-dependent aldehyde dehydrogenase
VFDEGGMTEQIEHTPLGVVANISAWNYPWFVGGNVFMPALLTGNAVLYKPSEYAAMTGLEIARLLHAAGVPRDVDLCLIGGGAVGAACWSRRSTACSSPARTPPGQRSRRPGPALGQAAARAGRQGPDLRLRRRRPEGAAESLADGAMYNTGQSCCSVERIYVHEKIYDAFVAAFVETVKTFKMGDPMSDDTYIGAITRAPQLDVLDAQVADAKAKGAKLLAGGKRGAGPGNWYEPPCSATSTTAWS